METRFEESSGKVVRKSVRREYPTDVIYDEIWRFLFPDVESGIFVNSRLVLITLPRVRDIRSDISCFLFIWTYIALCVDVRVCSYT